MDASKLLFCFEAKNGKGHPVYLIRSVDLGDFTSIPSTKTRKEAVIKSGIPRMGCGVFGSQIVLAGGLVEEEKMSSKQKTVITYDMATKEVSATKIPPMREGKSNPLVFQLHNKLFVLDTSTTLRRRSFEIYYPNRNHWHQLYNPYFNMPTPANVDSLSSGSFCYSWFVFGKCLCISLPSDDYTYLHDSQSAGRDLGAHVPAPLPFPGMATTYYQEGFKNIVVLSFSQGRVEGRRLYDDISFRDDPQEIFKVERSSQPGDISGYLSQFGDGCFCLTTFDKVNVHVYTFKIFRSLDKPDGSLALNLLSKNIRKYRLIDFSLKDNRFVRLVGCFGLSKNNCNKELTEAKLYNREIPLCLKEGEEDFEDRIRTDEFPDIIYSSEPSEPEDEPYDFSHLSRYAEIENACNIRIE